jgi:hypothetical protein
MTPASPAAPMRWQNYLLERGDGLVRFWSTHVRQRERRLLVVLGRGFDPRMCMGLELLLSAGGDGQRDVLLVDYQEGDGSPSRRYDNLVQENDRRLRTALSGRGTISKHEIPCSHDQRQRVSPRQLLKLFDSPKPLEGYSDIVVDISALPQGLYFPLLARILYLLDNWQQNLAPELHLLVAEDPTLDASIREVGIDEAADFLPGFAAAFSREATNYPTVWIPLLGENRLPQLERLCDLVNPDEVAPVLPSPARMPRRGDALLMEYRDFLFDQLRIDPGNILYASEQNPFEVYRQIRKAVCYYREVLGILGGCKFALSALSSKLMSVGALLVAYELKLASFDIGVAHIDCQGYSIEPAEAHPEIVGLWLSGECYAS